MSLPMQLKAFMPCGPALREHDELKWGCLRVKSAHGKWLCDMEKNHGETGAGSHVFFATGHAKGCVFLRHLHVPVKILRPKCGTVNG